MEQLNFWLLGGDSRQGALANLLARDGHAVHTWVLGEAPPAPLAQLEGAHCVLLPLPVSEGLPIPLGDILDRLSPGQFLCGGRVDEKSRALAEARGLVLEDYFLREELTIANAVPTAEGALQLAMEHLPTTIQNSKVLVVGYGRVGKVTAHRFAALGARVTVAARKGDQRAWAQAMGMEAIPLDQLPGDWDLVVNTVPALVLTQEILSQLRPDCLLLDLASTPGGEGV